MMSLNRLMDSFDALSRYFSIAGGWALLGLSVLVGIDVIGRKLFTISVQGADEIGGYVMAVVCAFGFSYTLKERAHIRLNILLPRLPVFLRVLANLLAYSVFTVFAYMMLWRAVSIVIETIELKAVAPTPLETPLVIPQSFWSLGLFWLSAHLTVYLLLLGVLIVKKQFPELITTFGVEQMEEEASHVIEDSKTLKVME